MSHAQIDDEKHRPLRPRSAVPGGVGGTVLMLLLCGLPGPAVSQRAGEIEEVFWRSVVCESELRVHAYLETYPAGRYVDTAGGCLEAGRGLDRAALRDWQTGKGFAATGYATRKQADTPIAQGQVAEEVRRVAQAEAERVTQEAAARAAAGRQRQAEEAAVQRQRERRNSIGMEFVLIEAETFEMGTPGGDLFDDEALHRVTLSQPFYLGKYEVTQEQWQAVMSRNPSFFSNCGATCPVENVSWEDVQGFIAALNAREGVGSYRLPTEAEWEYAARAGTQTAYHFGEAATRLGQYGWYDENAGNRIHPVGQKRPNGWGLYDMHGNVWEWVADWYGDYPSGRVTDPRGPDTDADRVARGGSWYGNARHCRAALRHIDAPGSRRSDLGFRLARTP